MYHIYPHTLPDRLKPTLAAAILREHLRFPDKSQTEERIKAKIFACAEIACIAVQNGEWRADLAVAGIYEFLGTLCFHDPDIDVAAHVAIKKKVTTSKEWLGYLERIEDLAEITPATKSLQGRKEFLLAKLAEKGMTRSRLATLVGVDPSVVYDYVSGKSQPRPENLKAIADVLGLKASDIPEL